jgi:hypothetical protein
MENWKNINNEPYEWILGYKAMCSEGYQILPKATCQLIAEIDRQNHFSRIKDSMAESIKRSIAECEVGDRVEFLDYKAIKIPKISANKEKNK